MPLLTITSSKMLPPTEKESFFTELAETYADIMDSQTSYLSLAHLEIPREDLWLGRADPNADMIILEAEIRQGRTAERLREFALAFMEIVHDAWEIPWTNLKVVFSEHEGHHLMGYDRVGDAWESSQ